MGDEPAQLVKPARAKTGRDKARISQRGSPRNNGTVGAPSTMSGGATDIRMKCCIMCAASR